MRKVMLGVLFLLVAGILFAGSYTDTDKAKNHGKTGLKNLTGEIDANFALVEGGNITSANNSLTNGQALTLSSQVHILTGTGGADGGTNTITLVTPYTADRLYILTVASGSTNDIKIADNGTVAALGSDLILEPTDAIMLLTTGTNSLVKVSAYGDN